MVIFGIIELLPPIVCMFSQRWTACLPSLTCRNFHDWDVLWQEAIKRTDIHFDRDFDGSWQRNWVLYTIILFNPYPYLGSISRLRGNYEHEWYSYKWNPYGKLWLFIQLQLFILNFSFFSFLIFLKVPNPLPLPPPLS